MRTIEAVIFDVGEVQFNGFYGAERFISECVGETVTNKQLQTPELMQFFSGEISEKELWRQLCSRFKWKAHVKSLMDAVRHNFTEVPGTRGIIEQLRSRGLKLGLLSVHGREWVRHIDSKYHYHGPFDYISYSYKGGPSKPEPKAFFNVVDGLGGHKPKKCLVVDDYHVNIEVAARLGFETHLFQSAELLQHDLEELEIL